ncbi:MAG: prefoldin subunit alpha [Thermoprotei archaeon]|nr:MAG: prefoldin subunit alpha [Thermoprotei archaeon]RLE89081.1 MAG: prefoldin subunit alpha [Thermoprotei archaeon]
MSEEEVAKLVEAYASLEEYARLLSERVQILSRTSSDLAIALETLEGIKDLKEETSILLPLGGQVYGKFRMIDREHVLVNIGANVFMEKTVEDAIEYLNKHKNSVDIELSRSREELNRALSRLQEIRTRLSAQLRKRG